MDFVAPVRGAEALAPRPSQPARRSVAPQHDGDRRARPRRAETLEIAGILAQSDPVALRSIQELVNEVGAAHARALARRAMDAASQVEDRFAVFRRLAERQVSADAARVIFSPGESAPLAERPDPADRL